MIQLPIQPTAPFAETSVADARPLDATGDTASVAGFRTQAGEPAAQMQTITVQSFLAQFDTARQADTLVQPAIPVAAVLPEEPPEEADAADPQQSIPRSDSPSGAEAWLAGMLGQAGLNVQARDNPQAQTSARIGGFATQAVDTRPQLPGKTDLASAPHLAPTDTPDIAAPASAPAPREAAQSQAQTLLQQHLAATTGAPDSPAVQVLPALPLDTRLPAADSGTPTAAPAAPAPLAFDKPLHLKGNDAHWGEQMVSALRDNVELQLSQRVQNATIRLDPPELGSLEILVRHEAGQLNVQISASHGDVVRMLQQTSDRLRQELVGQNFLQVNVQVSADTQSGQPGQQNRERFTEEQLAVTANPHDAQSGERAAPRLDSDVLITV